MQSKKKRGLLASAGAAVCAAAIALGGAVAANAAPVDQMPENSGVIITKLEQPALPGDPATGEALTELPSAPIEGVKFEAYLVNIPDPDNAGSFLTPGTNAWQEAVSELTITSATALVASDATPVRTGTTNSDGVIKWQTSAADKQGDNLDRGLYLIRETETPGNVVPAGDFLLAVPLTNPSNSNEWLSDIYVYPKNRTLEQGEKTVSNADKYVVGDVVTWTIDINNPSTLGHTAPAKYIPTDKFVVMDTIKDEFLGVEEADVKVVTPSGLADPADYYVELVAGTKTATDEGNGIEEGYTQIQVIFEATGRQKLADAMNAPDPVENVVITIDTTVKKIGVITNSAQYVSSETQTEPVDVPGTEVRYGAITLQKDSTDDEVTNLANAEFRVYLSETAAKAAESSNSWGGVYDASSNPNGYLVPADGPQAGDPAAASGIFITDATGKATIGGLRYSDYANGAAVTDADDEYQTYWLVETKALTGHQLLGEPVSFTITASDGTLPILDVVNSKNGGFQLPLTGGAGTLLLTLLGVGIVGAVLVVARRRNANADAE